MAPANQKPHSYERITPGDLIFIYLFLPTLFHKTLNMCAIYLPTLFLKTLNIYSVHYLLTNIISQNIKHLQYALPTFQHYFTKHKTFTVCATYLPTFFHKTLKTITFSIRESWLQNSSTMVTQMENLWNRCWMTVLLHLILT